MPKIEVNKVAEICKKNHVEPSLLRRIVEEMNLAVQPEPGEDDAPPIKKQFVILVSDPSGVVPVGALVGWVLQIPEDESPETTCDRIRKAAYDYNASKKGRLYPAKTVGGAIENVPAKFFKEVEAWIKTRTPVIVLRTDNEIPRE
jgi:hypothetical protein